MNSLFSVLLDSRRDRGDCQGRRWIAALEQGRVEGK